MQAFNSLGTTIAPQIGAFLILADATQTASKAEQISSVQIPYLGLAGLLIILAVFVKMIRLPDARKIAEEESEHNHDGKSSVWQYKHLVFGAAGIFCYVGAEVSIGSLMVNVLGFLKGMDHASAAQYLSFYWGGAMVGRFLGSAVMAKIAPNRYLAFNATIAVVLLIIAMMTGKAAMPTSPCGRCLPSASSTPSCSRPSSRWRPKISANSPMLLQAYSVLPLSAVRCSGRTRLGGRYLQPDVVFCRISRVLPLHRLFALKGYKADE